MLIVNDIHVIMGSVCVYIYLLVIIGVFSSLKMQEWNKLQLLTALCHPLASVRTSP